MNEFKDNHLKIIASSAMNLSAITLFNDNFKQLSMKITIEVAKFEPGPTPEKTINEIKDNNMKSITSGAMNLSDITLIDENIKQLSMKIIIEVETFEPEPAFEKTINEIKWNHMKSIASTVMNLSSIASFDYNFEQLSMKIRTEVVKFEPELTCENTINEIKSNHLKSTTSIDRNV